MRNMTLLQHKSLNGIVFVGEILLIICSLFNTAKYGASLSWVFIPVALVLVGTFCDLENQYIAKESLWLFLLWGIMVFSTLFSHYVDTKRDLITFLIFCICHTCIRNGNYSLDNLKTIVNVYIIVATLGAINIIYNWVVGNFYNEWYMRSSFSFLGVYKDPNYTGAFIVPGTIFIFIKFINNKKNIVRLFYMVILLVHIMSIFLCGSRGTIVTLALSVAAYFIIGMIMKKYRIGTIIKYVIIALMMLIFLLLLLNKYLPEQALDRFFNISSDSRLLLWDAALKIFKENPLIGGGLGAGSWSSNLIYGNYSHNVYIDIICDFGILGLSIFCAYVYKNCLRCCKKDFDIIVSIFIAFMFPLFFINGFNSVAFHLPLMMLCIFSKYSVEQGSLYNCL